MPDNFDDRLQAKRRQLDNVLAEMTQLKGAFCEATARYASSWYPKEAAAVVEREHDVTAKLSDEQLKALKIAVAGVVADARANIDDVLSPSRLWWHIQDPLPNVDSIPRAEDPWRYKLYGARLPDFIDKAVRIGLGKVGTVLEQYGYLRSHEKGGEQFLWRDRPWGGRTADGTACYPYHSDWSAEMRQTMERYALKQAEGYQFIEEIGKIQEEKERSAAKSRWNAV